VWQRRISTKFVIKVLLIQYNLAIKTNVLKLDAVFIVEATTNSMKFSMTKSTSMTAIKRE
jgi:hypothetical protein